MMERWDGEPDHSLVLEQLELDQRRIDARRARDAQRNALFQQNRSRTVDFKTLGSQVMDNERRKEEEKELDRQYADIVRSTMIFGEMNLAEETAAREETLRKLRADWAKAAKLPQNSMPPEAGAVDPLKCGLAAAQHMAGEDQDAPRRKAKQAAQLAQWSLEMQTMHAEQRTRDKEEEGRWAGWERHVAEQRAVVEKNNSRAKAAAFANLQADRQEAAHLKHALARAEKEAENEAERTEIARMMEHPVFNSTPQTLPDGRVPRDNYRGLTKGQLKRFFYENMKLQDEAARKKAENADDEARIEVQAQAIRAALEADEAEKAAWKQRELDRLRTDLEVQCKFQQEKKDEEKREAFGHIQEGVLTAFGKSYR